MSIICIALTNTPITCIARKFKVTRMCSMLVTMVMGSSSISISCITTRSGVGSIVGILNIS